MGRLWFALAIAFVGVACNPKSLKKDFCRTKDDCTNGRMCDNGDADSFMCISMDASTDRDAGGDGGDAGGEVRAHCTDNTQCGDGGGRVCQKDGGMCVECLEDTDCMAKPRNRSATYRADVRGARRTPNVRRRCPDPGVCMFHQDGRCATDCRDDLRRIKSGSNRQSSQRGARWRVRTAC